MTPAIASFFDPVTGTVTHVVYEAPGSRCAIIDAVLDFDYKSGRTSTAGADRVIAFVRQNGLEVEWLLETHAHADHVTAAPYIQRQLGGRMAIGAHIRQVQQIFKKIFNLGDEFQPDGSHFDHLFAENETFHIGRLRAVALFVPGHTPADMAYLVEDQAAFVGDTLFMPDGGTARCDFPGGDAHTLYQSVQKLYALPPETALYMCHDYPPPTRAPQWRTTVAEERRHNIHIRDGITAAQFVRMREARDATLELPTLILPSIQLNIRAGHLPPAEDNGVHYLKIPLDQF